MMRVFYGDDRVKAQAEIRRVLGEDYEVIEGAELGTMDLPSVFMGASLLSIDGRKILIRDLLMNKAVAPEVVKYVDTPHEVILFESKVDKRSAVVKELSGKVELREFKLPEKVNFTAVFDVYKIAKRDGAAAVKKLREIEPEQDPMMFAGLLVSQALKDYAGNPNGHEKRVLKELAKMDMQMKFSPVEPWLLVEGFLLRMKTI